MHIQIKQELHDELTAMEEKMMALREEMKSFVEVKVEEEEQKRITAECMRKIGGEVIVIEDD